MKLPAPAYRQAGTPSGRGRHGGASRQGNFILYCAPSCLPAGRDPAYKAGLAGHVPVK